MTGGKFADAEAELGKVSAGDCVTVKQQDEFLRKFACHPMVETHSLKDDAEEGKQFPTLCNLKPKVFLILKTIFPPIDLADFAKCLGLRLQESAVGKLNLYQNSTLDATREVEIHASIRCNGAHTQRERK